MPQRKLFSNVGLIVIERVKEYVIQQMLDKLRNMHGRISVRRYIVCWDMIPELIFCGFLRV